MDSWVIIKKAGTNKNNVHDTEEQIGLLSNQSKEPLHKETITWSGRTCAYLQTFFPNNSYLYSPCSKIARKIQSCSSYCFKLSDQGKKKDFSTIL